MPYPFTHTGKVILSGLAKALSYVCTPVLIPFWACLILFLCSYLRIMPSMYKIVVLSVVFCFTVLIPACAVYLFGKANVMKRVHRVSPNNRVLSVLLYVISYVFCLLLLKRLTIPWYMRGIILSATLTAVICLLCNLRWRLSVHMAGMGSVIAGLVCFGFLFGFNPVYWLCAFILLAGLLGSARMLLVPHSLAEVITGFIVGMGCTLLILDTSFNFLFRIFLI